MKVCEIPQLHITNNQFQLLNCKVHKYLTVPEASVCFIKHSSPTTLIDARKSVSGCWVRLTEWGPPMTFLAWAMAKCPCLVRPSSSSFLDTRSWERISSCILNASNSSSEWLLTSVLSSVAVAFLSSDPILWINEVILKLKTSVSCFTDAADLMAILFQWQLYLFFAPQC